MRNFMSAASLLFLLCWTTWWASGFQLLEVHPGVEVTLLCPNFTSQPSQISWFRAVRRSEPRPVSSIYRSDEPATTSDEFKDRFETTSNLTTIFLKIKRVDSSDSGLYFCGYLVSGSPLIRSPSYLEVEEGVGSTKLLWSLLAGLGVCLVVLLVGLGLVVWRLHPACHTEKIQTEEQEAADLNYASVAFKRHKRSRRESERVEEPDPVYSTTRAAALVAPAP